MSTTSKSKHTSGPWSVLVEETVHYVATADGDTPFILARAFPLPRKEQGDKAANVRLMAAAPDMLKELKHCYAVPMKLGDDKWADSIKTAIVKAIGDVSSW